MDHINDNQDDSEGDEVDDLNGKEKWSKKEFEEDVLSGKITPMFNGSYKKTPLNGSMCSLCYSYFPRINKCGCCNQSICSRCFIASYKHEYIGQKCSLCTKPLCSIIPNLISIDEQYEKQKQYPDDVRDIAAEFGLPRKAVDDILDSGEKIYDFKFEFFGE